MSARAIISTLGVKIKSDIEAEIWRLYMARATRLLTENTASLGSGKYMQMEYDEIINPKPEEKRSAQDIINDMKAKINS